MTALRQKKEITGAVAEKIQWLTALEQELKSRVGWVDEAVSPFAGKRRSAQAPSKIQQKVFPAEKAA